MHRFNTVRSLVQAPGIRLDTKVEAVRYSSRGYLSAAFFEVLTQKSQEDTWLGRCILSPDQAPLESTQSKILMQEGITTVYHVNAILQHQAEPITIPVAK